MKVVILMLYIAAAAGLVYGFHPLVHALGKKVVTMEIGTDGNHVEAALSQNGTLTISGKGRTLDYTEETAPFAEYADQITSVKIENGVTSIGDYLLYNCGNLKGRLVLPSSVIWVGDGAFSGDDREHAPKFRVVESRFQAGEIARLKAGETKPEKPVETSRAGADATATPGEAAPETGAEESTGTGGEESTEAATGAEESGSAEEMTSPETAEETKDQGESGNADGTAGPNETTGNIEKETSHADETTEGENHSQVEEKPESGAAEKNGAFTAASSRLSGILKMFSLNSSAGDGTGSERTETTISETTETPKEESNDPTISEAETEGETKTSAPAGHPSVKATDSEAGVEAEEEETDAEETTEESSEDMVLSNDLYEDVADPSGMTEEELRHYTIEIITSQIIGSEIFYPGQNGAYECEAENISFADAAETAGYRKADGYVEVDMEGIRETFPVIDGVFFAPELPEEIERPEDSDAPLFANQFTGWTVSSDWETLGYEAPIYEPGAGIPVDDQTTSVSLYANWENTCTIDPQVEIRQEESRTTYTVIDGNTGNAIPDTEQYQIHYQWQICRPIAAGAAADTGLTEEISEPGAVTLDYDLEPGPGTERIGNNNTAQGPGTVIRENSELRGPGVTTQGSSEVQGSGVAAQGNGDLQGPGVTAQGSGDLQGPGVTSQASSEPQGPGVTTQGSSDHQSPGVTAQGSGDLQGSGVTVQGRSDFQSSGVTTQGSSDLQGAGMTTQTSGDFQGSGAALQASSELQDPGTALQANSTLQDLGTAPQTDSEFQNPIAVSEEPSPAQGPGVETSDTDSTTQLTAADPSDESSWENIEEAKTFVYTRLAEPEDKLSYFRVMISVEKATFFRSASEPIEIYSTPVLGKSARQMIGITYLPGDGAEGTAPVSEPITDGYTMVLQQNPFTRSDGKTFIGWAVTASGVTVTDTDGNPVANGTVILASQTLTLNAISASGPSITFTAQWSDVKTIYVDATAGDDGNDGLSTTTAVRTLAAAYGKLDGTKGMAENRIVLCGTYASGAITLPETPATISGRKPDGSIGTLTLSGDITCSADTTIEDLTLDANNRSVWARGHKLVMGYGLTMRDCRMNLYGGVSGGTLNASANITICSGNYIWVASSYNYTQLNGDFNVTMLGGTISTLCQGYYSDGVKATSIVVNGNSNLKVYGGTIGMTRGTRFGIMTGAANLEVYGGTISTVVGGPHSGNRAQVKGAVNISIHGGEIGDLFGGAYDASSGSNPPCANGVNLEMDGGTITGDLVCGGYGTWDTAKVGGIKGDIHAELTGGKIKGNFYGGCAMDHVMGNVTINMSDIEIGGNVYGAGKGGLNSNKTLIRSNNNGNITLNIGSGTVIGGSVYGGIDSYGNVTGNVTVNYSGTLGAAGAGGSLYGGGRGTETTITGSTDVTVNSGATVADNVYGGGEEGKVTVGTTVRLAGGTIGGSVFGAGNNIGTNSASVILAGNPSIGGAVYGGSNNSGTTSSTQITINSATDRDIYGGGSGGGTTVTAATVTAAAGIDVTGTIFGGGNEGNTVDTTVDIYGNVLRAFGGGNQAGASGAVKVNVNSGASAGDIYGGSNDRNTTNEPSITVAGTAANVYGGGLGGGTTTTAPKVTVLAGANITGSLYGGGSAGTVTGGTTISVEGGYVEALYGGGNAAGITGAVNIGTSTGSTVKALYGGSNSSGTVESPVITIQGAVTTVYGSGKGPDTITNSPTVNADASAVITSLYGGGEKGQTKNGSAINLKNGSRCENVYGGGNAAGVVGEAAIHAESGSRSTNIYGGSNFSGAVDTTKVTIDGTVGGTGQKDTAEAPGTVYGGGQGESTQTTTTAVVIGSTGVVNGEVFGGGAKGPVTGNTTVTLEGSGTVVGNVYAGGDAASVNGSTWLEAKDGSSIKGSLYGGGKGTTAEIGTNTRVLAFAHVTDGNVFGGGAEGMVRGDTHVDIAKGLIDGDGVNTGNVFGGSDKAKVKGSTQVHIGWEAAYGTETDVTGATLLIRGTVFGGGNTTDTGSNFDASDPFVEKTATVSVDATHYDTANFNIVKSILGDGNMCTVKETRTVTIKNYQALGSQSNTSLQRADVLTLENSQIELTGAVDSANLVPTIAYSLNRIDHLIMKGGSTLKLQAPVNLVKELVSQDSGGSLVTTTATTETAAEPATKNRIDIQQGVQMELRTSEDVTTMEYGAVSGYMVLDVYDPDSSKAIESGIYVLGNYVADESLGGFLYGSGESMYKKIIPSTDEANWRNWAIGTDMKKTEIMIMSDKPAGGKIIEIKSPWPADGSIYRLVQNSSEKTPVTIQSSLMDGSKFVLKDPEALGAADPVDTTLGISIQAGNQGWVNPMTMGYIEGDSTSGAKGGGYGGLATETLQTLNNRAINPTILVELTNRGGISKTDDGYPLTVTFQLENVKLLSDGGYSVQGTLTVELQIRRESMDTYDDILISTGKEYVRATQTYTFGIMGGDVGATITQKSAITLQYGKKENGGEAASDHKLSFSIGDTPTSAGTTTKLPAGVTILAVDRSSDDPIYAHYTVPAGGISEVKLSQFIKNGSDEPYSHSLSYYDKENYLFILDFANAPADYSQDKLCATFEPIYTSGSSATVKQMKILFSIASGQPGYKISSPEATEVDKEGTSYDREAVIPLTLITYAMGGNGGVDTTGTGVEMGVRLRLKSRDAESYVPVPTDWFVEKDGKKTGELAGGGISVILGNGMMSSTSSLGINTKPSSLTAGKYQWEIYLTSSALSAYPGSLTGTPLYLNFNIMDKRYSVEADYKDPSASRLYPAEAAEPRQPLKLCVQAKAENGAASDGVVERASLWKKDQTTGEYAQVDFGTLFDGLTGTTMDYDWQASRDITYTLKNSLPEGTYRLRYELVQTSGGANQVLTYDTENFIVTP